MKRWYVWSWLILFLITDDMFDLINIIFLMKRWYVWSWLILYDNEDMICLSWLILYFTEEMICLSWLILYFNEEMICLKLINIIFYWRDDMFELKFQQISSKLIKFEPGSATLIWWAQFYTQFNNPIIKNFKLYSE